MDGTDRRIQQTWSTSLVKPSGASGNPHLTVEELSDRKHVVVKLKGPYSGDNEAVAKMTLADLDTAIRIMTDARTRLEAFGTMEGLEKVVP